MHQARKLVPKPVRQIVQVLRYATLFSDVQSLRSYLSIVNGRTASDSSTSFVDLSMRQLNQRQIRIRTHGRDAQVLFSTFYYKFHLPPPEVVHPDASIILDLGANIGCTMAHLAYRYPAATVVGVELDNENSALALFNTQPWAHRCRVVEGAVWPTNGDVQYEVTDCNQDGYSVLPGKLFSQAEVKNVRLAQAYSVETICSQFFPGQVVDFVKMDIEGAEKAVLKENTAWIDRIRCIKIELHGYEKSECIADLNRLGLSAWPDTNHPNAVIGVNRR